MTWHRDDWTPEPPTAVLELMLPEEGRWASVGVVYRRGRDARLTGHPDHRHPGEPGWFEVEDVTLHDDEHPGTEVVLIGERLKRWAEEHHEAIQVLATDRLDLIL